MSTIKEFKEKVAKDVEFASKFKDVKTAEEAVALAKAEGFEITVEEIKELSESDLEGIAGGNTIVGHSPVTPPSPPAIGDIIKCDKRGRS
jgi:predicted ribosomally synthesized peptide with nif11-like leader